MIRIEVTGAREVQQAFAKAKLKVSDLSAAWQKIGRAIAGDAKALAPVLSGTLANSIRAAKSKSRATVRAGNGRMEPYAGVIHFGGYNNIEPHPFLTTALHRNAGTAKRELEQEIQDVLRRSGFL